MSDQPCTVPVMRIDLSKEGLLKFLGSIELSVLLALWEDAPKTKGNIYRWIVSEGEELAYTSVSTVVDRLVSKKLIKRSPSYSDGILTIYYYPTYLTEEAFTQAVLEGIFSNLKDEFSDLLQPDSTEEA